MQGGRIERSLDTGSFVPMLLGGTSFSWSGGDKTTTDSEFIDLDTASAQSPAGTKNFSISCQPNIVDPEYQVCLLYTSPSPRDS